MSKEAIMERKRRRSSMFTETRSAPAEDSGENRLEELEKIESEDKEAWRIKESIANLKQCKKKWTAYVIKLKKELEAIDVKRQSVEFQKVADNYLDYLPEEDRKFMISLQATKNHASKADAESLMKRFQHAQYKAESLKKQYDLLTWNVEEARGIIQARLASALSVWPTAITEVEEFNAQYKIVAADDVPNILFDPSDDSEL